MTVSGAALGRPQGRSFRLQGRSFRPQGRSFRTRASSCGTRRPGCCPWPTPAGAALCRCRARCCGQLSPDGTGQCARLRAVPATNQDMALGRFPGAAQRAHRGRPSLQRPQAHERVAVLRHDRRDAAPRRCAPSRPPPRTHALAYAPVYDSACARVRLSALGAFVSACARECACVCLCARSQGSTSSSGRS